MPIRGICFWGVEMESKNEVERKLYADLVAMVEEVNRSTASTNVSEEECQAMRTESDMDILAITNQHRLNRYGIKHRVMIGEVKNFSFKRKENVDEIYRRKFRHIDNRNHARSRLKEYVPLSRGYDKIVFCRNVKEKVSDYAKDKYGIRIITATQILSNLAGEYKQKRKRTYYAEQYNYNTLRIILESLAESKYRDKLLLQDLIILGSGGGDRSSGKISKFVQQNQEILEWFAFKERHDKIIKNLIDRLYQEYPRSLIRILKENSKLWREIKNKRRPN